MRIRLEQISAWDESNKTRINDWLIQLVSSLNGGLEFGKDTTSENVMCSLVNVVTPDPSGTEFTVPHSLGRKPEGAWWFRSYGPGEVYFSSATTATSANVYLMCSSALVTGTLVIV